MGINTDISISMAAVWQQNQMVVRARVHMLQRAADAMLFGNLEAELEARGHD
jgi:hypothetical protein